MKPFTRSDYMICFTGAIFLSLFGVVVFNLLGMKFNWFPTIGSTILIVIGLLIYIKVSKHQEVEK